MKSSENRARDDFGRWTHVMVYVSTNLLSYEKKILEIEVFASLKIVFGSTENYRVFYLFFFPKRVDT